MNEKDFNYKCNELRKQLEKTVNESGMPIAVVYLILKDLYNEIEKINIAYLNSIAPVQTDVLYDANSDSEQSDNKDNN